MDTVLKSNCRYSFSVLCLSVLLEKKNYVNIFWNIIWNTSGLSVYLEDKYKLLQLKKHHKYQKLDIVYYYKKRLPVQL